MFSQVASPLSFYTPMVVPELPPTQPMDPSPTDAYAIFIHPPFTTFPDAHRYPDGLSYAVLAANPDWFLDPRDFISVASNNSNAIQYPIRLEPPRKRNLKALGSDGVTETGEPRFRCTFCRKNYSGENAKSMWRRHVVKRHGIMMSNRRELSKVISRGGRRANTASSSTAHADDDNSSDGSEKMSSPLDEALALVEEKPKIPKTEYELETEAHRTAQRSHMLQWASQLSDPVSVSFNRRTATFVGLAIRQMAKQAYDQEQDSDGDSEGHTANRAKSFETIMSRQTEESAFKLRRVDPSWCAASTS